MELGRFILDSMVAAIYVISKSKRGAALIAYKRLALEKDISVGYHALITIRPSCTYTIFLYTSYPEGRTEDAIP